MEKLTKKELLAVEGGFAVWGLLGIFGGISFIIGIIDGYIRPKKCNK
ncbi:MAG: hypothetical protein PHQ89_00385 [Bacilli bacterium]|nr:hypothetical protein [Bacilli bacterium]